MIAKMGAMPRSVDALKVEHAIVFVLHRIDILIIYCSMQNQQCGKDVRY